jgi:murein DD-endopeptidase MepM/ murein hydrolase activator NlpD
MRLLLIVLLAIALVFGMVGMEQHTASSTYAQSHLVAAMQRATPIAVQPVSDALGAVFDRTRRTALDGTAGLIAWAQAHGATSTFTIGGTATPIDTAAGFSLSHGCSLSADEVDAILTSAGSPVAGLGSVFATNCARTGIDDAYALAMFRQESGYATDPSYTFGDRHNPGNIMGADGPERYADWQSGIAAQFDLLAHYRDALGKHDIADAIATWAPPTENDTARYVAAVEDDVTSWRAARTAQPIAVSGHKHPVTNAMTVTAGFADRDCGLWGNQPNCQHLGVDYAGGDGDPVFAPFDGSYMSTGEYQPGDPSCPRCQGQYVVYRLADGAELYAGHLQQALTMPAGSFVPAGTIIGRVRGDLAHTHIQLRQAGALVDFAAYYRNH